LVLGSRRSGGGEASISELLFMAAAMVLSAEHISYNIPVKSSMDISPYLSLLRYKSSYKYGNYSNTDVKNEQLSFAVGLEFNKYFKRFLLSPYFEYNMVYVDHISRINAGVYCGIFFVNKRS
jgi:hypothetical protein